jgi:pimeloyl-ACP methyl ester carboxylesterase
MQVSAGGREVWYPSPDGLKLFARDHGPERGGATPVVCLPGLTRNSRDFETIAPRLSANRRLICPDFRGRGLSASADPATYRPDIEMADTLSLMDMLGIARAAVIGTSRGGIVAMFMAAKATDRLAGVAFNDIGPRIDKAGLLRIRSYLGSDRRFVTWGEAVAAVKATNPGCDGLSEPQWFAFAKRLFVTGHDGLRADYDPRLGEGFPSSGDIEAGKVPELWGLYDKLSPLPALVIQGIASDLLSETTMGEMLARCPGLAIARVPGRGHVPFLDEPEATAAIDQWLARVDADEKSRD